MGLKFKSLSIGKRDEDCYDVHAEPTFDQRQAGWRGGRVAALRAQFQEVTAETPNRIVIPGTWYVRIEHPTSDFSERYNREDPLLKVCETLRFQTVHEAFAFYCSQVLEPPVVA